jgi:hypothetical protein
MQAYFLQNVLSIEHCNLIEEKFLEGLKNNNPIIDDESYLSVNAKGIYAPYKRLNLIQLHQSMDLNRFFSDLTSNVSEIFKQNISYSHSFLRIYYNKSELKLHTDRNGLDITLSVNIGGLQNWPLQISNVIADRNIDADPKFNYLSISDLNKYKDNSTPYLTPKGSGVVSLGVYPHWRDVLVCKENEYVMQMFYHWRINK